MVTHFIFLSSSYSLGTRIALDYIVKDESMQEKLKKVLDKISDECGKDVSVSTHMVQAENETWESLCKSDHYFNDVMVIDKIEKFIKLIKKDRTLEGIDVAKYILSKIPCTQLKLQKLVYLCYAEYLYDTDKSLFIDKIYAFKYGPVVQTVYKRYKKYGYEPIEKETQNIDNKNIGEMPAKSRILFAEDGTRKIISIDRTLEKYGDLSATELVNITHKKETPWSKTKENSSFPYTQITDRIIKEYHKFEL